MSDADDSPLGRKVAYAEHYAPQLLFPIPRAGKRAEIGVMEAALPFVGHDLWNAYELSWLDLRGKPVVALGQFRVPATSPCLVESKSLKLYLNSFNQTRFSALSEVAATIASDLSGAAGEAVSVRLTPLAEAQRDFTRQEGACLDALDIEITQYQPAPQLLVADATARVEDALLYSHLLKSNCLVTGQPDWGMLAIRYRGPAIDHAALLRYIVSFRRHDEFHEQCVERIFCDLMRRCAPERLAVWARYTRRGGLDINPLRATDAEWATGLNLHDEIRQ